MTTLPIKPIRLPANLTNVQNGQLPPTMLTAVDYGLLHPYAAKWYLKLKEAAKREAGIDLTWTWGGMYRSLSAQETLFYQRFMPGYVDGGTNRFYNGQWYHLKPGMALAATPGKSNHGLALAIDLALGTHPSNAKSLDSRAVTWLVINAGRFGFCWEVASEPWHVVFYQGKRFKGQWS